MPDRDHSVFLRDIVEAIGKIERYTAGMTYEEFILNEMAVDAVIRNFEIIGEAASHVPEVVRTQHNGIPWDKMKAMRNIMIHEYFGVDLETVWKTARQSLPALRKSIVEIKK